MANDRISIVCRFCGWRRTLFRYDPRDEFCFCLLDDPEGPHEELLTRFFQEHLQCRRAYYLENEIDLDSSSLGLDPGLLLVTEAQEALLGEPPYPAAPTQEKP